jgi:UDP-4-amino-4,6-dideoxy-N-acetyl-beta-L-altrosamine transaminase
MIPYGRQDIDQADIEAVVNVLRSDFLTQGPVVPAFENAVAEYCNAQYAVAVNSATSALHLACVALNIGPGDKVWTTPLTFVASANCALYCGASIDFVDVDPNTYNLCTTRLAEKLEAAEQAGALPKVVIPVHLTGQPCDMKAIHDLSLRYGFKVIEDASHAIGGKYLNEPIGNCRYSAITVFSFHPVKIITSAEGGMALTNDEDLAQKMRLLRSHGITTSLPEMKEQAADEIWNYQQIALGWNYRMTEIQAALGLSQLARLNQFVSQRHEIARRYDGLLEALPLKRPWQHPNSYSSYHLYVIRLDRSRSTRTQRHVYDAMRASGILVNLHYIPVYRQPYFERMGFAIGYCPQAEAYFEEALSIPIYPSLDSRQQELVVAELGKVLG